MTGPSDGRQRRVQLLTEAPRRGRHWPRRVRGWSDSDWSGPGLRGPGRLGASGVEVPHWQRRGWRAANGGGRHGGRAPGSDRGSAPAEIEPFRDHRAGRTQRGWAGPSKNEDNAARVQWGDKEELPQEADAADLPVSSYNVAPHLKRNACSFSLLAESSWLVCCEGRNRSFPASPESV